MASRKKKKTASPKISLFIKIVLALNIFSALLLILSYWAPDTDPRDNSIIPILGFLYQPLFVVNILLAVFWGFKRSWLCLISIATIIAGYSTFLSYIQFNSPQEPKKGLKLMNYNVKQFSGIDKFYNAPIQKEVLEIIKDESPDIIAFEEFATDTTKKDTTVSYLREKLKYKYNFVKYFGGVSNQGDEISGNAIFSILPIVDTGTIPSPGFLKTRAIFADIKYKNDTIRVYCLHLSALNIQQNEKAKYLKGDVSANSSTFILRKLSEAFVGRSLQVSYIKRHIQKCPYPYIICGDFNDTPNSYSVNEIGDGLKNAFIEKGNGFETTYYSTYPLHIDHIFTTPDFNILNYQSFGKKISDHKPIMVEVN
jgi:endonuclease/exonuclease/phosphatase family metal-dependent hydrolase